MLANTEMPAGRRYFWPIYEAAERLNLPIGLHAGSSYRFAPSNAGWPSYFIEEYASNAPAFKQELLSLITEGVFQKFPALKVVLIEAGFTWLPGYLLAHRQNLARRTARGALGQGCAIRTDSPPCPLHPAASRRAA